MGQALKLKRIRGDEIEYEEVDNSKASKAADRWQRVRTLIIDESERVDFWCHIFPLTHIEVSMIDGRLFDKLVSSVRIFLTDAYLFTVGIYRSRCA